MKKVKYLFLIVMTFFYSSLSVFAEGRVNIGDVDSSCDIIPESVLEILKEVWAFMLIIGAIFVVLMSAIDIFKTLAGSDEKGFGKIFPRIIKRIIGLVILIVLPIILNYILKLVNENFGTCIN